MNLVDDGDKFQARVSSVLNRNVKEFGKKYLFDGREDTCWNSDQGSPQFVVIAFDSPQCVQELQVMFQGGFAGKNCWLEVSDESDGDFRKCFDFYPDDSNKMQCFQLASPVKGLAFKVVFGDSSDFFGRVTVYQLKLVQGH